MNWEKILRIRTNLSVVVIAGLMCLGFANSDPSWKRTWSRIPDSQATKIFADPTNAHSFWAATSRALYHMDDSKSFSLIAHKNVNWVYQDPANNDDLYLAADDGLFVRTLNSEMHMILGKHECLSVTSLGQQLFVGTKQGLFIRDNSKERWRVPEGKLATEPIELLASFGKVVYVTTLSALYRYDPASNEYKQIFSAGLSGEGDLENNSIDEERSEIQPKIFDLDIADNLTLYVSTQKGIFYTNDEGKNWHRLSDEGLPLRSMNALSVRKEEPKLWAATAQGVYRYLNERWEPYYQGLDANQVSDLIHDNDGNLYAATNRGFFILPVGRTFAKHDEGAVNDLAPTGFKKYADVERYFDNEPTISEVQSMAVEYADVHPDKIKRWQRQSRLKGLVPSFSTGIDRSATDLMHWDTGANPDALTKGKDFLDWDVNLSWNLGDLVWSSDQTSIDSRSKLMVELREEILDQVTRVYFERRRLQAGLLQHNDQTHEAALDDQMRLAELTAIIDGYTGGKFSRGIEEGS